MRHLTLLLLTLGCLTASAQELMTRTYDTRQFRTPPVDVRGPELGLTHTRDIEEDADKQDELAAEEVAELIQEMVEPDSWDEDGRWCRRSSDRLTVRSTPAVHAKIRAMLDAMTDLIADRINLEVTTYDASSADVGRLLAGGPVLDGARLDLIAKLRRISQARMSLAPGVRSTLAALERHRFTTGLLAQVAEGAAGYEPHIETVLGGMVRELRAARSHDGTAIKLMARLDYAEVDGDIKRRLAIRPGIGKADTSTFFLDRPEVKRRTLDTQLVIPTGGSAVLAVRGSQGRLQLTVVHHRRQPQAKGGKPAQVTSMRRAGELLLLDLGFLTMEQASSREPELGTSESSEGVLFIDRKTGPEAPDRDELIDIISERFDGDLPVSSAGPLVLVRASDAQVAEIKSLIAGLEQPARTTIHTRSRVLRLGDEAMAALRPSLGTPLSAQALRAIQLPQEAVVVELGLSVGDGHEGHSGSYHEQPIVAGYDAEVSASTSLLTPVISTLRTGEKLSARPSLLRSRGKVLLQFSCRLLSLSKLGVGEFRSNCPVHKPLTRSYGVERQLMVPIGGGMLLDLGDGTVLLVEATVSGGPAPEKAAE